MFKRTPGPLRGRRGPCGTGLGLVAHLGAVARGAAPLCVAGVPLGDIDVPFAWQAWLLVTLTFHLRGRRGTWRHPPSFCVAGVARGDIDVPFAWQAWHLVDIDVPFAWRAWHLVTLTFHLRGRCGTCAHPPSKQVWHVVTSTSEVA